MATYTITINERTKTGKNLVAFLSTLSDIVTIKPAHTGIDEALDDVKNGRLTKAKDATDLLKQCL